MTDSAILLLALKLAGALVSPLGVVIGLLIGGGAVLWVSATPVFASTAGQGLATLADLLEGHAWHARAVHALCLRGSAASAVIEDDHVRPRLT